MDEGAHPPGDGPEQPRREAVDWGLAVATARRLIRPGPATTPEEAAAVVAELRRSATEAERHVRATTGLSATAAAAPVVVVDRIGWAQANTGGLKEVIEPLVEKLQARAGRAGELSDLVTAVGSRVTAVEAGAMLAFLAGKVLGQFDPFWTDHHAQTNVAGRLLLVAPNVVQVERELGVDPHDFRLWVCLHEETHRVQFTAVPWLRGHLRGLIADFVAESELDAGALLSAVHRAIEQVARAARGGDGVSVVDLIQSPRQREILGSITAVMSLLEGHADVVMDDVGPDVVPSVATIRRRFQQRRHGGSALDQLLKKLLGMDAKLRQYRDGAAFVRAVVGKVGMAGFNEVWGSPRTLPTIEEITDPAGWLARVRP